MRTSWHAACWGRVMKRTAAASVLLSHEASLADLRKRADFEGAASLDAHELVALLIGSPTDSGVATRLAAQLLVDWGGLGGLVSLRPSALVRPGLGAVAASRLAAALAVAQRLRLEPTRLPLSSSLDAAGVAAWACPRLGRLAHEEVWVLCVDGRSVLRSSFQVGRGGIHGCSLLPRDVLGPVVRQSASGFVLVHNHPSGDPTPSFEDLELTRSLRQAAYLVGSPLLDHVIVAGSRHTSLSALQSWGGD